MSRVEHVEEAVMALDADELAQFRAWFAEYDCGISSWSVMSGVGGSTI